MSTNRDRFAETRGASADRLDEAIDRVAKQWTRVDNDAQFAQRIVAALPDRRTWFGWLTQSWVPRLALIAIVAMAAVLFNGRQRTSELPAAAQPIGVVAYAPAGVEPLEPLEPVEPLAPVRTMPLEPLEPMEPLEPFAGLPSIAAPAALATTGIAPEALPLDDSLSVPALVIDELPLTAESFPEQD